jgi:anion-transporting  ArsA/GET3 family ATPase
MVELKGDELRGGERLNTLLSDSRVLVAAGCGGVGKTTTAAALAIAAGRRGRKCAVLTIDPAKRLAQALGLETLNNTPQALPADLVGPGAVDAMMLEVGETFDDLIARLVPDPARRERLMANRLYQALANSLGGTHEYMAVERLFELSQSEKYDLVVVDTPPSVNALDFIDAPKRIAHFFSDKIARFFIRKGHEQKGLFQRIKDRAGEVALAVLGKALGEGFVEELQDFATAFQGLFAAFRQRGEAIEELLADPGTSFVVVTGADPVRVAEAMEFTDTLGRLGIEPHAFIANRVHQASGDTTVHVTATRLSELSAANPQWSQAGELDVEALAEAINDAQRAQSALSRRDRAGLLDLVSAVGAGRVLVVQELEDEVQDRAAVEHVISALAGPDTAASPTA